MKSEDKRDRFLGRAVRDGKIMFTSVSQIKLFDADSDGCPRKWAFSYLFGKKLERTGAQEAGTDHAEKLEHYLTTGEDVLPPVLQPAKKFFPTPGPDLQCEQYLGDMEKAITLREQWLRETDDQRRKQLWQDMYLAAGLLAGDVPVDGAADVRHRRGWFIDQDGNVQQEARGTYVVNIDDLKTVSRIYPHTIKKGPNAGMVLQSYCKTDAEVGHDIQMVGYGKHADNCNPGMTHARLGLIYANREKREAAKRMALVSVEQIRERWHDGAETIVKKMEQVATAVRIEDVEPNTRACDSFTHVDPLHPNGRPLKGCGHRYYCPLAIQEVVPHLLGPYEESAMSLFDQVPAPPAPTTTVTPSAPPPPPVDPSAHAAAVEAEKRRLAEEDARRAAPPPPLPPHLQPPGAAGIEGYKQGQLCNGRGFYANSNGQGFIPVEPGHSCAGCAQTLAPPPPPPPALPIQVNPPDQPKAPGMLEMAAPVPPNEITQIDDPELRQRVEEHARQHAERAAQEAAKKEQEKIAAGAAVWCPMSAQKINITVDIATARKYVCQCGKTYTLAALKPIKENDQTVSVLPRHKLKKEEAQTSASPPTEKNITIVVEGQGTLPLPPAPPASTMTASTPTATPPAPPPSPAPPVAVAPPAPPAPPVGPVIEVEYAHANGNGNGNGHTNGNGGVEHRASNLKNFGINIQPHVSAYAVGVQVVEQGEDGLVEQDVSECVVIAESIKAAMEKAEAMGEVVSIELLPGPVLA